MMATRNDDDKLSAPNLIGHWRDLTTCRKLIRPNRFASLKINGSNEIVRRGCDEG
jgi:hypothetical protein